LEYYRHHTCPALCFIGHYGHDSAGNIRLFPSSNFKNKNTGHLIEPGILFYMKFKSKSLSNLFNLNFGIRLAMAAGALVARFGFILYHRDFFGLAGFQNFRADLLAQ